jgi:transposase
MIEYLAIKRVAALEGITDRAVQLGLDAGRYNNIRWQSSRGGRDGKRALIHRDCLSADARRRLMAEEMEQAGPRSLEPNLQAYLKAPEWARNEADGRFELLKVVGAHAETLQQRDELALTKATEMSLSAYNGGLLAPKLRSALGKVGLRSLYRWRAQAAEGGPSALLPGHGGGRQRALTDEQRNAIGAVLLARGRATAKFIHGVLRARFGREVPSYRTVLRAHGEYLVAHGRELSRRQEPEHYARRMQPALGHHDRDITEPNQMWEIDSTRADLLCKDGRRRIGIAVVDVYSRRRLINICERDSAADVAALLRRAFITFGIPRALRMDNGKNYFQSTLIQQVLAEAEVEAVKLPSRRPDKKPFVEINFGTWQRGCLKWLDGYTAESVANRPEIIRLALPPEEVQDWTDRWIAVYEEQVHTQTGQRPRERFQKPGWVPRKFKDERELDILLFPVGVRTVKNATIAFDNGTYFAVELGAWEGRQVELRRPPEDAGTLIIWSMPGQGEKREYVCKAVDPERKGWTVAQICEAQASLKKADKLRLKAEMLEKQPLPMRAYFDEWLRSEEQAAPAVFPQRAEIVQLPAAYRQTVEAMEAEATPAEPPAPPDLDRRPDFNTAADKYEWLFRRRCLGLPLDASWGDGEFIAEFEQTPLFESLQGYYAGIERFLKRRIANE